MAKVFIEETTLTAIGDAIRGKTGKTALIDPANMSTEIASIEAGSGGGADVPEVVLTGDCSFACSGMLTTVYLQSFPTKVSTKDITNVANMFKNNSTIESIPFSFNISVGSDLTGMFSGCAKLKRIPDIDCKHTITYKDMAGLFQTCYALEEAPAVTNAYPSSISYLFYSCSNLRNIPNDFFSTWNFSRLSSYQYANLGNTFAYCHSLRAIPTSLFEKAKAGWIASSTSYSLYCSLANYCYALDEIVDLPVNTAVAMVSGNYFRDSFVRTFRLRRLTFETNNGAPIVAEWKGQTIDLNNFVGISDNGGSASSIVNFNSGITVDKEVQTDEQYQALKNDPDWWTPVEAYSRYNHDSAVETINSLPDTSAYLAANGGTNTIQFRGNAGSKTDGGAINTLTEEEIAVATAKGWTVTIV